MYFLVSVLPILLSLQSVAAEDGLNAWLRYASYPGSSAYLPRLPREIIALSNNESNPVHVAGVELQKGILGIFNRSVTVSHEKKNVSKAIVVGTLDDYNSAYSSLKMDKNLEEDGFWLDNTGDVVRIVGQNSRGALYGAFEYLSKLAQGDFSPVTYATNPGAKIRWSNEWDNLEGSIERGYGGASIFFKDGKVVQDLDRVAKYGRLLASIRINGIFVNNVNANPALLSDENMRCLKRIADTLRPYGIQIGISLNFASPQTFGGLTTFDPIDASVIAWWTNITNTLYSHVPDLLGYLVKANSEGQPGPLTYNRTLAEGANLFAKALQPHAGTLVFRAFVYDNKLNQTVNWKADRANAAVEFFRHLDGKFDDNVVVQIKYGPIDFQVREPASPLFANLRNTSTMIELQVTQEYLGQQCHLVYLAPMWKEILDFDMRVDGQASQVKDIVSGRRFNRPLGGFASVTNMGTNSSWLGSHLAMSNLYAYGRLAWNPEEDSIAMLQDWVRLTFSHDRQVINTITDISMKSWPAYEDYSGNLGIQTLTDITYTHYGPNPASQDGNGWGQWTRADHDSIGMDRTVYNGTGFAGQYPPDMAEVFEDIESTPDNLLLWFHHVPYTHRLHSGKTVIQEFYDAHYRGAATAQTFATKWASLRGKMDTQRFEEMLYRLTYQAGHSIVWRDAVSNFYRNLSGIQDEQGRVGTYKWRIEAESMNLTNYKPVAVTPFETASQFKAVVATSNATSGTATTVVEFESGVYNIAVNYYDLYEGWSTWQLYLNSRLVGEWKGDFEQRLGHDVSRFLDGHTATRITFPKVKVTRGNILKIVGTPNGTELAPLDYVSFLPLGVVD